jgi:hypothetical protein
MKFRIVTEIEHFKKVAAEHALEMVRKDLNYALPIQLVYLTPDEHGSLEVDSVSGCAASGHVGINVRMSPQAICREVAEELKYVQLCEQGGMQSRDARQEARQYSQKFSQMGTAFAEGDGGRGEDLDRIPLINWPMRGW